MDEKSRGGVLDYTVLLVEQGLNHIIYYYRIMLLPPFLSEVLDCETSVYNASLGGYNKFYFYPFTFIIIKMTVIIPNSDVLGTVLRNSNLMTLRFAHIGLKLLIL